MEQIFKAGDLVRIIKKPENDRYVDLYDRVFKVERIDKELEYVYVRFFDDKKNIYRNIYQKRFELDKPRAITPGCTVVAIKDVGVSVKKDRKYIVQAIDVPNQKIKLTSFGNWMRFDSFKLDDAPAIVLEPPKDEGELLLKELSDKVAGAAGTCSYVLVPEKGAKHWHVRDACHARMSTKWRNIDVVKHVALNIDGHFLKHPDQGAYREWVQYILFESGFKKMFLTTTLDKALASGVLLDVEKPTSQLVAAAVALRAGSEHRGDLEVFKKMLDIGFSKHVAFVTGIFFKDEGETLSFADPGGAHHFVRGGLDFDSFVKCINEGVFADLGEQPYKIGHKNGYVVCNALAKDAVKADGSISAVFRKLKGIEKAEGRWGDVSLAFKGKNRFVKCGAALSRYFD